MNCEMWAKPAVQRNVAQLKADGRLFVDPGDGWLSCGQIGQGRMAEPSEILAAIRQFPFTVTRNVSMNECPVTR